MLCLVPRRPSLNWVRCAWSHWPVANHQAPRSYMQKTSGDEAAATRRSKIYCMSRKSYEIWHHPFFHQRITNKDNARLLLDKITVTKKELFKFRLVEDEACVFCLQPDSIEHTFLDCTATTAFYSKAISSIAISLGSITKITSILLTQINK